MNLRGAGGACWCYLLSMRVPFLLPILRLGVPDAGLGRPGGVEKCKWRGPHESRVNKLLNGARKSCHVRVTVLLD